MSYAASRDCIASLVRSPPACQPTSIAQALQVNEYAHRMPEWQHDGTPRSESAKHAGLRFGVGSLALHAPPAQRAPVQLSSDFQALALTKLRTLS